MKENKLTSLGERLDKAIDRLAFSGVLRINKAETLVYERAAGYANRSHKVNNSPETRFGIASGTKFFTALAIGKLIEDKRLSLSSKLRDCLYPDRSRELVARG